MSMSLESTMAILQARSADRAQQAARAQQAQQGQQTQQSQQTQQGPGQVQDAPSPAARSAQWNAFQGTGADQGRQSPVAPPAQSPLAQAQAQGNLRTNQDLINHCYKNGGNTWAGASRVAQSLGADLNALTRSRGADIGSAGATAANRPSRAAVGAVGASAASNAPTAAQNVPSQARTSPATSGAARTTGATQSRTAFGQQIGDAAERQAQRMNSTGQCALGVNNALVSLGVQGRGHAFEKAEQLANNPRFRETNVSAADLAKLPRGAVVVWGKSAAKPWGHVSVALGNGREASDHIARQMTGGAYGTNFGRGADPQGRQFRVFLPN